MNRMKLEAEIKVQKEEGIDILEVDNDKLLNRVDTLEDEIKNKDREKAVMKKELDDIKNTLQGEVLKLDNEYGLRF